MHGWHCSRSFMCSKIDLNVLMKTGRGSVQFSKVIYTATLAISICIPNMLETFKLKICGGN